MKKTYQTIENSKGGNCLEACLASIFEDDINEYPRVAHGKKWPHWINPVNDYLIKKHGCWLLALDSDDPANDFKGYYIIVGGNEGAKFNHAMVGFGGKLIWDPSKNPVDITWYQSFQYLVICKHMEPTHGILQWQYRSKHEPSWKDCSDEHYETIQHLARFEFRRVEL